MGERVGASGYSSTGCDDILRSSHWWWRLMISDGVGVWIIYIAKPELLLAFQLIKTVACTNSYLQVQRWIWLPRGSRYTRAHALCSGSRCVNRELIPHRHLLPCSVPWMDLNFEKGVWMERRIITYKSNKYFSLVKTKLEALRIQGATAVLFSLRLK